MRAIGIIALLALAACSRDSGAQTSARPLEVRIEPAGDASRLVLTAAAGWKINARLKPALETPDGSVLHFDAAQLTADSAYFAEPPAVTVPGRLSVVRGTLRASVCAAGERVCRLLVLRL